MNGIESSGEANSSALVSAFEKSPEICNEIKFTPNIYLSNRTETTALVQPLPDSENIPHTVQNGVGYGFRASSPITEDITEVVGP